MEVTKLYNVVFELVDENENLKINALITNLINSISQNQAAQIEGHLNELNKAFDLSKTNFYSISSYTILKEISGEIYFGEGAKDAVEEILNSTPFNNALTVQKLQEFNKKRADFISKITQLNTIFESLDFSAHFYDDDIYEVGLIFPENVTENKIKNITTNLHKWDQVFKTLKEITGEEVEDTKISLVNNGSLEFFFENAPQIALCLSIALERLATLYKRILEIRTARLKLEELGAPKSESNAIQEHEKKVIEKEIKEIVEQIFKEHATKLEAGRKNELKNALTSNVKFIAKSIDKGIVVEITPPEVDEPEIISEPETDENKKEKETAEKAYKEKMARVELAKKRTELAKEIFNTGKEVFKYLTTGEEKEEDDKNEE
ncbi:MAG: hypothetical protein L6Q77_08085 [Bacteroidetes bacterium]|nr:hypothetical protein [Bacteroidota bacterium]